MKIFQLFVVVAVLYHATPADAANEKPVTIPLKSIWAYAMPGTRDIRELEPAAIADANKHPQSWPVTIVEQIAKTLRIVPAGQTAATAFVVAGTGETALRNVHAVMVKDQKPVSSFPIGSDVSIFFFSHTFGYYVHIKSVKQLGHTVKVHFEFVPHRTKELTMHFALVPLKNLPARKIEVEILRRPATAAAKKGLREPAIGTESRVVSRSFDFEIVKAER